MGSPIKFKSKVSCDFSGFNQMMVQLEKLTGTEIEYGYYGGQHHPKSKLSLADIAYINEYGSSNNNIPSRPFMRQTFHYIANNNKMSFAAFNSIFYRMSSIQNQLKIIAKDAKIQVERTIERGMFAANRPSTLSSKAPETRPLIETGYLKGHAKYKFIGTTQTSLPRLKGGG